ncbi:MAG: hypothetical protein M3P83_11830 [Actinomycetota bacterium]|nr:hypothetical protein [Actinomycetota bacterium]
MTAALRRKMLRNGSLVRLRRGVYCTEPLYSAMQAYPVGPLILQVRAAQARLRAPSWATGLTSARLHGLVEPLEAASLLSLVAEPGTAAARRYDGLRLSTARVPVEDRTTVHGAACLALPRTLVDIARTQSLSTTLLIADDAVRKGVQPSDLAAALRRAAGKPGIRGARVALSHVDGRRETPIESESFAFFVEAGLPLPEPQVWLGTDRVDFYWRAARLVGEADGKVKYSAELGVDDGDGDALWREKGRSDRLEDRGESVVRWTYADLRRRRHLLEARLRRHLGLG